MGNWSALFAPCLFACLPVQQFVCLLAVHQQERISVRQHLCRGSVFAYLPVYRILALFGTFLLAAGVPSFEARYQSAQCALHCLAHIVSAIVRTIWPFHYWPVIYLLDSIYFTAPFRFTSNSLTTRIYLSHFQFKSSFILGESFAMFS